MARWTTDDPIKVKKSVGIAKEPVIEWAGSKGKGGYLWFGDDTQCLFTMHGAEVRKLRDLLVEKIGPGDG